MAFPKSHLSNVRKCPVTHQTTDQEDFEHDFTTQGRAGSLECPFAKIAQTGPTDGQPDPIAAEFHSANGSATSPAPAGQCPIRFLDKHSPEEIAQYFENHKHEIPRSHEICVKRYQQNEQGIRQLDAKYGNLVNMIQGLGVKHKQYLPNKDRSTKQDTSSSGIAKWAEDVSQKSSSMPDRPDADIENSRVSRFEKPLREIRVGESPSRPWGISVPVDNETAASALESEKAFPRKEPGHSVTVPLHPKDTTRNVTKESANTINQPQFFSPETVKDLPRQTQFVFNGPVFFGYSAEDAAKFLRSLDLGATQGSKS